VTPQRAADKPKTLSDMNNEFLLQHVPFNQMKPEHLQFLSDRLQETTFPGGAIITGPDAGIPDKLFIIKQGRVRGFTRQDAANDAGIWELVSGEAFPIGALLSQRPVHTWHKAMEETHCYELAQDDFATLMAESSIFNDFCTRRLANLLEQAVGNIQAHTASTISHDNSLNTSLRNLLAPNPISCSPDTPVRQALEKVEAAQRRSIAVLNDNGLPIGILTLRDVMVRITLAERSIDTPIGEVMTPVSHCFSPDDFAADAAFYMAEQGLGHVCVTEHGRFVGLLSERDLFSLQRIGLGNLSRAIQRSRDLNSLKQSSRDIIAFTDQMLAQGASVSQLMRLITTLNDLMTRQVIQLCENESGSPAIPFTWLSFGSEGRMEQTLKTDQDNGILFECEADDTESVRRQLLPLAARINAALNEIGFPLCPGNIMASNPECCLSKQEWQARFRRWINSTTPENLLNASIFFDFRSLHGADKPVQALRAWLNEEVARNSLFRRQMADNALRIRPPLGLFGDLVTRRNEHNADAIDLKLHGITPFVDAARIIALANKINVTNTIDRLREAARLKAINQDAAESWIDAYQYIQLMRMQNHRQQMHDNAPINNWLDTAKLNDLERRILKETFRQARKLQSRLSLDYQL